MLEAMKTAQAEAQKRRTKPFHLDVQYIFVEKDGNALAHLRQVLIERGHGPLIDDRIHLIHGEFVDNSGRIMESVRGRGRANRAIFMLDQFGYTDAPLPTIREILSKLENAEVILTFATDSLIDYLSTDEASQAILKKTGLSISPTDIATAKQERDWRRAIQYSLHRQIPAQTGAKYYTPFFIRSQDAHRDFWLIHLSGHYRARDVMVGLHWQESTSFAHYGGPGLGMLGYNQRQDPKRTRQLTLPGFFFDQTARVASHELLSEQLPGQLAKHRDGIPFADLFSSVTNDCPVTADIMREILSDLARSGVIRVKDKSGNTFRRSGLQSNSDIILPNPQKRLFLPE